MKLLKIVLCWILLAAALASCGGGGAVETTEPVTDAPETEEVIEVKEIKNGPHYAASYYTNNLIDKAADPFILSHNGMYYLYCTGGSQFSVRSSTNLKSWRNNSNVILKLSSLGWAKDNGWAPEMYEYNGKFYFIFSARAYSGIYAIDIAVSDAPDGKFVPLTQGKPFFQPEYSVIDASLFFDDDGRIYMYYSKDCSTNKIGNKKVSQTYGVEVKPDFSGIIGEPVLISTPEKDWELKSGNTLWNEGPVVFKKNGVYYLLFSANFYQKEHYSVGYAVSDTPLRFFDKADDTRILAGNGKTVTGPGHCNILRSPDGSEIYVVYHVHTVPPNTDGGRSLAIDRLIFKEDGTLELDGPSETRRPLPSGLAGFVHINEGFTYEVTGERTGLGSDKKYLFDWYAMAKFTDVTSFTDGGTVDVTFEKEENVVSVMVYPANHETYVPEKIDVLVNGEYLIKDLEFKDEIGAPVIVNFTNLPEGTLVKDIKITVHAAEGRENAALAEIIFIAKEAE